MVEITNVPSATASATSQSLALQFKESICPFIKDDSITSTINYVVGDVKVVGSIATATVTAQITSQFVPVCHKLAKTVINTETFPIAFTATTANTITIVAQPVVSEIVPNGCKRKNVLVTTAITATIA